MLRLIDPDDPFTQALLPPSDETPGQLLLRSKQEKEAKRISDEIDAQLKQEKKELAERNLKLVRVLLLGQSESGKSTTLKNFQMVWAPQSWKDERASWRSVVLLNVVKSSIAMVAALLTVDSSDEQSFAEHSIDLEAFYNELISAETVLKRRLSAGTEVVGDYRTGSSSVVGEEREIFIPSNISWKDRFLTQPRKSNVETRTSVEQNSYTNMFGKDEVMEIMVSRKHNLQELWGSPAVQELLHRRGLNLEENPGFFMNDLDRILDVDYEPSDDDVVRARLRTMGIQEHKFRFETGTEAGRDWVIYDVGGSRPQRASWFSFFEDIQAIIFLVPTSCFDEVLEEEQSVSRLQDSLGLWKAICRSPLLARAQLILFLNKVDLLQRKLQAGVQFSQYVKSYKDRPNDRENVCRFLRNQFKEVQKRYSPQPRSFNAWLTCATDTRATGKTLGIVRHGIIKEHFRTAELV